MKKTVYLLLMMAFILGACSRDPNNNQEPVVEEPNDPPDNPDDCHIDYVRPTYGERPEGLLEFKDYPDEDSYWEAWVKVFYGDLERDLTPYPYLEDWDLTPYLNVCDAVADAVVLGVYPGWGGILTDVDDLWELLIDDETVRSMSTCGLLETMLQHRDLRFAFPVLQPMSGPVPGFAAFNCQLRTNKVAVEFFAREDCISVLVSKYLSHTAEIIDGSEEWGSMVVLGMLMASDRCLSMLSEKEKSLFIAMGLERAKYTKILTGTCHILIAIMKSYSYAPFMAEVLPMLIDWTPGYMFDGWRFGTLEAYGLGNIQAGVIVHYAKQFYKQRKK